MAMRRASFSLRELPKRKPDADLAGAGDRVCIMKRH